MLRAACPNAGVVGLCCSTELLQLILLLVPSPNKLSLFFGGQGLCMRFQTVKVNVA